MWLSPPAEQTPGSAKDLARARRKLRELGPEVARQSWRVTKLLWQTMLAALLPLRLRDIPGLLERFLEHLGRTNDNRNRERSVDRFRRLLLHVYG